jgi:hypothetical protein
MSTYSYTFYLIRGIFFIITRSSRLLIVYQLCRISASASLLKTALTPQFLVFQRTVYYAMSSDNYASRLRKRFFLYHGPNGRKLATAIAFFFFIIRLYTNIILP